MKTKHTWFDLKKKLKAQFDEVPSLEGIIYLIGLRELGIVPEREFEKEEKLDLMHIAICRLLSISGYYKLGHLDQDGWPHWELIKPLPHTSPVKQEAVLRDHIVAYFEEEGLF